MHALSCKWSESHHQCHAAINDINHCAMSAAHLPSRLEQTGLLNSNGKRPDGVTLVPHLGCHLSEHICPLPSTMCHQRGRCSGSPGCAEQAGEVHSPQPMPQHKTAGPLGQRFRVLERTKLLSQTGHWGSQVILLPAATPVCRSVTGKHRCNDGNNGGASPSLLISLLDCLSLFEGC